MLESPLSLTAQLLSDSQGWLFEASGDPALQSAGAIIVDPEPSTLALAIIGIASVAVYMAATGWRPARSAGQATPDLSANELAHRSFADAIEDHPTRGAA